MAETSKDKFEIRFDEIKKIISTNKLEKGIRRLNSIGLTDKQAKTVLIQKRKLHELKEKERNGVISYEDINIEKNKITLTLLQVIDDSRNTYIHKRTRSSKRKQKFGLYYFFVILISVAVIFIFRHNSFKTISEGKSLASKKDPNVEYKILILPFESYNTCTDKDVFCELALQERFNLIDEQDPNVNISTEIYEAGYETRKMYRRKDAVGIGLQEKANMIIWGNYHEDECDTNQKRIKVRWANIDKNAPFYKKLDLDTYQEIANLENIEDGVLTGNVEEIVYWSIGLKFFNYKNYDKALDYLSRINKVESPEYAILYFLIANSMRKIESRKESKNTKILEEAMLLCSKALELNPGDSFTTNLNARVHNTKGIIHHELRDMDSALKEFNSVLLIDSTSYTGYLGFKNLSSIYLEKKEYSKALHFINRAQTLYSKDFDLYRLKGICLAKTGRPKQAIQQQSIGIKYNASCWRCYKERGVVYHRIGKYRRAIKDCELALEHLPRNVDAFITRGLSYQKLGKKTPYHESQKYFSRNKQ